jgi:hypothetical protein
LGKCERGNKRRYFIIMAFNAAIPKVTKVSQTNPTNFVSLPQIIRRYIEKESLI